MEQRLRFARTKDDVALPYWAHGEGPPLIHMPWLPWSHVQREWQSNEIRPWLEAIGAGRTLIRYDGRGTGLADRSVVDFSLEAQVNDLECIADTLKLERFLLLGVYHAGPAALLYAARHPDRLAGLVLWGTYARNQDYYASERVKAIRDLLNDWELYTETGAHAFVGWGESAAAHEIAAFMREASSSELTRQFFAEMREVDYSGLLSQIAVPTLVIHPRLFPLLDPELARRIAVGIEGARLVFVEGEPLAPTRADLAAVIAAIEEFTAQIEEDAGAPASGSGSAEQSTAAAGTAAEPSSRTAAHNLTKRELEILLLVAKGQSNRDVAEHLVLSPRTVERHIENIFTKINVHNRSQATAYALSNGLG